MGPEATLHHTSATLRNGSIVRTPFWHIDSGQPGEALMLIAAQHGNEVQGCEVIRQFKDLCEVDLRAGSVWLVPFANVPAVQHRRSHISLGPEQPYSQDEGHNMNRTWPGDPMGNDTERVASSIHEAVARNCTRCLDLHSWSRFTATATLTRRDGGVAQQMAAASAIRFVQWRTHPANGHGTPCTIGALFNDSGRGAITIELAPQWVIRQKEVSLGMRVATNLAKLFGMMDGEMELIDEQVCTERHDKEDEERTHEVKSPCRGLFVEADLETSDRVEEGQYLGHLIRDDVLETVELTAPATGYLWVYGSHRANCDVALPPQHPYTDTGDLLATVIEP